MKSVFKKMIPVLLVICLLFSSCGNSAEKKYAAGKEAMDKEEWDAAIGYFTDLDYNDSADLLQECLKEKGMREKSDYDFLETLSQAVIKRLETSQQTNDIERCVAIEYEMLGRFKSADFYDNNLKTLALAYIDGIEIEKQSLSEKDGHQQLKYYEGHSKRFQTLKDLTDQYGFLANDVDYKTNYYNKADEEIELYAAYQEIEADLDGQFGDDTDIEFVNDTTARIKIRNHTLYDYDINMHFTFFDEEGTIVGTNEIYYEDVRANANYNIDFNLPDNADSAEWFTEEFNIKKSSAADGTTDTVSKTEEAYNHANTLTKDDLTKREGKWFYKDLPLLADDCDWIESDLNKAGTVEHGAIYRKIAMLLEGFQANFNKYNSFSEWLIGFTPATEDEFEPYAENAMSFIVTKDEFTTIMKKFESLSAVSGDFDFGYGKFGKFSVDIPDLTACAEELQISEEMLGYVLDELTIKTPKITFRGNSCHIEYESIM